MGPRSAGRGRPRPTRGLGLPGSTAGAGTAPSRVWLARLLGKRGRWAGGCSRGPLRRVSRGRPALPHPSARVTTARRPARRPPTGFRGLGLLPAGSDPGGRSSTKDAEVVSERSGRGSFRAAQGSGLGSLLGPAARPLRPCQRAIPTRTETRRIPRLTPPGAAGLGAAMGSGPGSFPPNRTNFGCACSAPGRVNPDRASAKAAKRSSSGAIG